MITKDDDKGNDKKLKDQSKEENKAKFGFDRFRRLKISSFLCKPFKLYI